MRVIHLLKSWNSLKMASEDKSPVEIEISSGDFHFKVVEFLQQNWALIDESKGSVTVWFISDTSEVFDKIDFATVEEAQVGLRRNGFRRLSEDAESQKFIAPPRAPFFRGDHVNGAIYSSGRFWEGLPS